VGTAIDLSTEIGLLLESEVQTFPGMRGPDLAYDGAFDPKMVADAGAGADGGANPNPMNICFQNNGASSTFIDINVQKLVVYGTGDGGTPAPDGGGVTNLPLILCRRRGRGAGGCGPGQLDPSPTKSLEGRFWDKLFSGRCRFLRGPR